MNPSFVLHTTNCRNVSNDYTKLLFAIDNITAENLRERGCYVKSQTTQERGVVYSVAIKIPSSVQCDQAGTLARASIQLGKLYDIVILGKPFEYEGKSGITLEGYCRPAADPIEEIDPRVEELLSASFAAPTHNPRLHLKTPSLRRLTSVSSVAPERPSHDDPERAS